MGHNKSNHTPYQGDKDTSLHTNLTLQGTDTRRKNEDSAALITQNTNTEKCTKWSHKEICCGGRNKIKAYRNQ